MAANSERLPTKILGMIMALKINYKLKYKLNAPNQVHAATCYQPFSILQNYISVKTCVCYRGNRMPYRFTRKIFCNHLSAFTYRIVWKKQHEKSKNKVDLEYLESFIGFSLSGDK